MDLTKTKINLIKLHVSRSGRDGTEVVKTSTQMYDTAKDSDEVDQTISKVEYTCYEVHQTLLMYINHFYIYFA